MALFKRPIKVKKIPKIDPYKVSDIYNGLMFSDISENMLAKQVGVPLAHVLEVCEEIKRVKSEMDKLTPGYQFSTACNKIKSNMFIVSDVIEDIIEIITDGETWAEYQEAKKVNHV